MKKTIAALSVLLLLPLGLSADEKGVKNVQNVEKKADKKPAAASEKTEKKEGCMHGEKAAAKTAKGAEAKHECKAEEKGDVILTGKLLCEHCNLHRSEKCASVFKAEGRDGEIPLCPETKDMEKIKAAGEHGTATLEVKGTLCRGKDGKQMLMISSFTKKA